MLEPATILETVTVTPSRSEERLGNIPASINILDREDIRNSPAVVADDVLRQIPTFSLFRRTSSLSSHPTAQGVSLRGIGPSGVSRTLVLIDGVPFNDPFGGWVYWTRVPLESVDRIEVVDGSSSSLYGNYAMGGVINIVSSRPARRTVEFKRAVRQPQQPEARLLRQRCLGQGRRRGRRQLVRHRRVSDRRCERASATRSDNEGDGEVSQRQREARLHPTSRINAFVRGGYFSEERDNGKVSTIDGTPEANDTRWKSASGGVRSCCPIRATCRRASSPISRRSAATSSRCRTPGGTAQHRPHDAQSARADQRRSAAWRSGRARSARGTTSRPGTDLRWVDGDSEEDALDATTRPDRHPAARSPAARSAASGRSCRTSSRRPIKLTVTLSARVDRWRNYDAHNLETAHPRRHADARATVRPWPRQRTRSAARASRRSTTSPIA